MFTKTNLQTLYTIGSIDETLTQLREESDNLQISKDDDLNTIISKVSKVIKYTTLEIERGYYKNALPVLNKWIVFLESKGELINSNKELKEAFEILLLMISKLNLKIKKYKQARLGFGRLLKISPENDMYKLSYNECIMIPSKDYEVMFVILILLVVLAGFVSTDNFVKDLMSYLNGALIISFAIFTILRKRKLKK